MMSITSPNISQVMKTGKMTLAGLVAYTREKFSVCRIVMGRPEGKRPIGRTRHQWQCNVKMGWEGMGWLDLGRSKWQAVVNMVMNIVVL
jgi:hypothetical protein